MSDPNRLYFGNVSFDKTQEEMETFFSQCGEVKDCFCVKDRMTQRFQGYGFITFTNSEGKAKALALNGTDFGGRRLKVNGEDRGTDKTKSGQRIFIKNIPTTTSEEEIKAAFAEFGTVEAFFTVKDKMTRVSKGFGFLDFSTGEEAKNSLAMDGQVLFGKQISVKIAHEKKPVPQEGGFGGGYGGRGGGRGGGFAQSFSPYGAAPTPPWFGGRGRGGYQAQAGYGRGFQQRGGFSGPRGGGFQQRGGFGGARGGFQQQGGYGGARGGFQQGGYGGARGGYGGGYGGAQGRGNQW